LRVRGHQGLLRQPNLKGDFSHLISCLAHPKLYANRDGALWGLPQLIVGASATA